MGIELTAEERKKFNRINTEYKKAKYDSTTFLLPKGTREVWKNEAEDRGLSLSKFIQYCVNKEIKRK